MAALESMAARLAAGRASPADIAELHGLMDDFRNGNSGERLADFYAAADVVLVPSRSESFGLVALEAQACGTPVVAARVGGLPFVVDDGATGFLVDGHDPKAHAARVLDVLRDADLQARFGIEAAYRALRFTWDGTADEVARVYREVAAA